MDLPISDDQKKAMSKARANQAINDIRSAHTRPPCGPSLSSYPERLTPEVVQSLRLSVNRPHTFSP
jgi:hypothetical protein